MNKQSALATAKPLVWRRHVSPLKFCMVAPDRWQPGLGLRQGIGISQVAQCCTPAGNCNTQDRVARPLEADHPQGQAPVPRHPRSSAGELCKQ